MAAPMRVVFDTSVLVAASRSRRGASFALLEAIPSDRFQLCVSVALFLEWQDALCRPENVPPGLSPDAAMKFTRYLVSEAHLQEI